VRVRWEGSRVVCRVIGARVWGPENDWTCDVEDPAIVAQLLAQGDPFSVVAPADAADEEAGTGQEEDDR